MRIYISVDMEGAGGIVRPEQVQHGTPAYEMARRWLTEELLAVVRAAREAGVTEIWIKDAHARATNLLWDRFDGVDVRLVQGAHAPNALSGLNASFAGMFLIGYHAHAGTPDAVLAHTWDQETRFYFNGVEVGEIAIDAALAGAYGVPIVLVSGDDKTAGEAKALLGTVETVVVGEAITEQGAVLYSQPEVQWRIEASVILACRRLHQGAFRPYVPALPLHFRRTSPDAQGVLQTREAEGEDVRAVIGAVLDAS